MQGISEVRSGLGIRGRDEEIGCRAQVRGRGTEHGPVLMVQRSGMGVRSSRGGRGKGQFCSSGVRD